MGYGKQGIEIKDPLTLRVPWHPETVVHRDSDRILSITPYELPEISLGTLVKVNSAPYRINRIDVVGTGSNTQYELSMAQRTKSSLFLLPMLPGHKSVYLTTKQLINCFMSTPDNDRCISLLYRFHGSREFVLLESHLTSNPDLLKVDDVSKSSVLYTFRIPEKYLNDYDRFLNGQYSQFSDAYKDRILKFHESGPMSVIGQILYKSNDRRKALEEKLETVLPEDAEVFSVPDIAKETYDPVVYSLT